MLSAHCTLHCTLQTAHSLFFVGLSGCLFPRDGVSKGFRLDNGRILVPRARRREPNLARRSYALVGALVSRGLVHNSTAVPKEANTIQRRRQVTLNKTGMTMVEEGDLDIDSLLCELEDAEAKDAQVSDISTGTDFHLLLSPFLYCNREKASNQLFFSGKQTLVNSSRTLHAHNNSRIHHHRRGHKQQTSNILGCAETAHENSFANSLAQDLLHRTYTTRLLAHFTFFLRGDVAISAPLPPPCSWMMLQ